MKYLPFLKLIIVFALLTAFSGFTNQINNASSLNGAWSVTDGSATTSLLISDGYCMITTYDKAGKNFSNTWGGSFTTDGKKVTLKIEFNSNDKAQVGKTNNYMYSIQNNILTTDDGGEKTSWNRIDEGKNELAGNWRIIQRKDGDKMIDIPLKARRTFKLLTGSRFQWAAINIETGEFFGTGGGTYTFKNGKYTEHIEFFSRDNSRVGSSLNFDGKLQNGKWIHSGLSSKGDPMYEVWAKFKR